MLQHRQTADQSWPLCIGYSLSFPELREGGEVSNPQVQTLVLNFGEKLLNNLEPCGSVDGMKQQHGGRVVVIVELDDLHPCIHILADRCCVEAGESGSRRRVI